MQLNVGNVHNDCKMLTDFVLCIHGGLMISALVSGSSDGSLSPGWGHCVVFLGNTLYSHRASLSIQVYKCLMGTGKFYAGGNPAMD